MIRTDSVTLQGETTDGCLRSRYEAAVLALRAQVAAMRGVGVSSETIARAVHAERRRLTIAFKEVTRQKRMAAIPSTQPRNRMILRFNRCVDLSGNINNFTHNIYVILK
jgi:hypothetical protein